MLVAETFAVREVLRMTTEYNIDKIIMKSDSHIVINFINGLVKVRNQIIVNVVRNLPIFIFIIVTGFKITLQIELLKRLIIPVISHD